MRRGIINCICSKMKMSNYIFLFYMLKNTLLIVSRLYKKKIVHNSSSLLFQATYCSCFHINFLFYQKSPVCIDCFTYFSLPFVTFIQDEDFDQVGHLSGSVEPPPFWGLFSSIVIFTFICRLLLLFLSGQEVSLFQKQSITLTASFRYPPST